MLTAQGQCFHPQYSIRRKTPAALAKSNSASVYTAVSRAAFNVASRSAPALGETTKQAPLVECPPGGHNHGHLCKELSVRGIRKLTAR